MRTRLLLSLLAFAFGGGILVISLFSAAPVSSTGERSGSENTLYFSATILPDHVFYPALMVVDRLQLVTASDYEKVFIQIKYAHNRLQSAEELLKKGKQDLAVTTLTKGEKYIHQAVSDANKLKVSQSVKERLKKAVEYHSKRLQEIKPGLTDANRATLDQILKEHETLTTSLAAK